MDDGTSAARDGGETPKFAIFRGAEARDYAEHNLMGIDDMSPAVAEGLSHFARTGNGDGQVVQLVYAHPGLSLTYVWFKSGYPLPLHSHTAECLYYIIGGSLRMGDQELGIGNGFFVATDVPYTYTPGPEGVEVLEFRTTDRLNIRFMAKNMTAWAKTAKALKALSPGWVGEKPPREAARDG
jgi:hypothetical protein